MSLGQRENRTSTNNVLNINISKWKVKVITACDCAENITDGNSLNVLSIGNF